MAVASTPEPGSIITYLDPRSSNEHPFSRAITCAGPIPDPQTEDTWIPAMRERKGAAPITTLVDQHMIVDVKPPTEADRKFATHPAPPNDPIGLLRAALDATLGELTDLDAQAPQNWHESRRMLTALLDTIAPARQTLVDQIEADPHSPVALVLGYLDNAIAALDAGDVIASRAALRTAQVAVATILPGQPD
ncbi:MAG TPA: hypothetical protein VJX10_19745 [Pseudonocardiaceae bacterium]|nr:hypothetical protein [Pseudonocardiaceae bacterium]